MSATTVDLHNSRAASSVSEAADAQSWGLALIRSIAGIVFLAHGIQKVFLFGVPGVAGMMGHLGIPLPGVSAFVVSWLELLGGAALLGGILTRPVAALLAVDMLVAILKVHLQGGFFLPAGFEFALTLLALNVSLLVAGPGALALDNKLFSRRS